MSALDLTTVQLFKAWQGSIGTWNTQDDPVIEACIAAWGAEFLWRTGMGDQNGDMEQSPFNSVCNFDETYDGKGGYRFFPTNRPIQSVSALIINGISIPQSTGYASQGWVIDGSAKSISLRSGFTGWGGWTGYSWPAGPYHAFGGGLRFWRAIQNVNIQYMAGYQQTPDDIVEAANIVVLQNYKRRKYQDEASRSVSGGGGSIRYRDWEIPPQVERVVRHYSRTL